MNFFVQAPPDDPWNKKVRNWQARHHLDPAAQGESLVAESPIARKYGEFTRDLRRKVVTETVHWVQTQSRLHYRPDGTEDHWATLGEVVETGGDDCDGLELLTYHFLRDMGFRGDEVYRAIVHRPADGQHHMVTLWFEDRNDPWVLDPTGAMTRGMPRMSELPEWVPLKVFSDTAEYTVRRGTSTPAATALAANP